MNALAQKWSDPVITTRYNAARAATNARLALLREAVAAKDAAEVATQTQWLLSDAAPKVYFALRIGRSGKVGLISPSACIKAALNLKLTATCTEKVPVILRKKKSGKVRLILNFGLRYRVAQNIIRCVLSVHHRPRSYQFTHRGVPKAVTRVRDLINQGNHWFAHLDIKEFYPSFRIEKLRENASLGGLLPPKMIAAFVHARELEIGVRAEQLKRFPYLSYSDLLWEARRGIPTGSCASSVVAPMMVSRMSLDAATADALSNYEDDFFLLAPTKDELQERIEVLMGAVKTIPGGHFKLELKSSGRLGETEACFLGHAMRLEGDETHIMLTNANREGLFSVLTGLVKVF